MEDEWYILWVCFWPPYYSLIIWAFVFSYRIIYQKRKKRNPKRRATWQLSLLAQAAITKYHRLGGLNTDTNFLRVPEAGIWDQGTSMVGFWWELSSWFGKGHLLAVCSPGLSSVHNVTREGALFLFSEERQFHHGGLKTSSEPNYFPRPPPPDAITLWVRVSMYELGGRQNIQPITTSTTATFPLLLLLCSSLTLKECKQSKRLGGGGAVLAHLSPLCVPCSSYPPASISPLED